MKSFFQTAPIRFAILLLSVTTFVACKRESVPEGNKPPIAFAGKDTLIIYPADTVVLKGNGTDPDGMITRYDWRQASGPAEADIENPNAAVTGVKWLYEGVYEFELKVTDNGGLSAKDKVQVTVIF